MNNRKHRSVVLNSSEEKYTDEEQADMAAAAPALAALLYASGCYCDRSVAESGV